MTDEVLQDTAPAGTHNPNPIMEEFGISSAGILKLLKNLKPGKAAGPDRLKPLLLRELREEIAPILQVIFDLSLQIDKLPSGNIDTTDCHRFIAQ